MSECPRCHKAAVTIHPSCRRHNIAAARKREQFGEFKPHPGEDWKPVAGYEGLYAVSSFGRVRRVTPCSGTTQHGLIAASGKRYLMVHLRRGGHHSGLNKSLKVHRLVSEAFLGPRPDDKQVNHKDGNTKNNHVSNLEYVTQAENNKHSYRLGLRPTGPGSLPHILTEKDVLMIRTRHASGKESPRKIASDLGLKVSTVTSITTRRTWRHL